MKNENLEFAKEAESLIRKSSSTPKSVKVEWYNAGEGICGDFNPDNPEDINLLRFDVYSRDNDWSEWEAIDDASYCTQVPKDTDPEVLKKGLRMIMDFIFDMVIGDHSIKKVCERLSWIDPDTIKNGVMEET